MLASRYCSVFRVQTLFWKKNRVKRLAPLFFCLLFLFWKRKVGVNGDEGTPVPIPNTVVKLIYGDNTWLATAREDNSAPTQKRTVIIMITVLFYFFRYGAVPEVPKAALRSRMGYGISDKKRSKTFA